IGAEEAPHRSGDSFLSPGGQLRREGVRILPEDPSAARGLPRGFPFGEERTRGEELSQVLAALVEHAELSPFLFIQKPAHRAHRTRGVSSCESRGYLENVARFLS